MSVSEIKKETPNNINELVKMADDKANWRKRLEAVNELKNWKCQKSRDVLTRLAMHDLVFKVKEEALRATHSLGITKNGKRLKLGKPKAHLIKDINKKLYNVDNELKESFEITKFKEKFKQLYPEPYDVYEGDRGSSFDEWILNVLKNKPKNKSQNK
ncbi:HEAT repeat domain-containing protein [Clostridium psychrophilum]|uniref:HEAT repeat domain-containing protein n=1 Tax=Clostridium psychrophilum TaxID=132926 RepID=UPI001C0E5149|nr:HEAT repeat domain-containing protein [Clostridium psychrophilum]MBU3179913.1 HEAT repeat domain-containing protein [Clostridium psychrophilum]